MKVHLVVSFCYIGDEDRIHIITYINQWYE